MTKLWHLLIYYRVFYPCQTRADSKWFNLTPLNLWLISFKLEQDIWDLSLIRTTFQLTWTVFLHSLGLCQLFKLQLLHLHLRVLEQFVIYQYPRTMTSPLTHQCWRTPWWNWSLTVSSFLKDISMLGPWNIRVAKTYQSSYHPNLTILNLFTLCGTGEHFSKVNCLKNKC